MYLNHFLIIFHIIIIVQELAVRCIQRNVRAFMQVRDWPWWRLLVRVTPLLNVHRTEEQLKIANNELTILRVKLEKLDGERNLLKTENSKLESKVSYTYFLYVYGWTIHAHAIWEVLINRYDNESH